ncbi:MAG: ABC transporter permease [Egibacteraceae bacterium]
MTTTSTATTTASADEAARIGLRIAATDAFAVAGRYLTHLRRQPRLLVFSTIQPVMFVLLFVYVFGGALERSPLLGQYNSYKDFLLPGIFVQSVAFGSTQTAVALAEDLAKGVIDRFRSLPMARSAVLAGRTLSDLARSLFVITLMALVGLIIGFRPEFPGILFAILLVAAFGFAFSWIYAYVGLTVKGSETAQAASFVVTFPLVFASAVFVPTDSFPTWLQGFAETVNPITKAAEASRALATGVGDLTGPLLWTLGWIVVILAVFVPLSVWRYRKAT